MANSEPQSSVTVFVPRWRLFAYRAAGWRVRGGLDSDFVEIEWPLPGEPVFLPPCNMSADTEKSQEPHGPHCCSGGARA